MTRFWLMSAMVFVFSILVGCAENVVSTSGCQDLNSACASKCLMERECLHSTEPNSQCMDDCLREWAGVAVPNAYHDCYADFVNAGCGGTPDQINSCLAANIATKSCSDGITWQACDTEGCCGYAESCVSVCVNLGHASGTCDLLDPDPSRLISNCSE
jgi:hypothetical protein